LSDDTGKKTFNWFSAILDVIGVAGVSMLTFGVYQIYIPAAYIVLGLLLILYVLKANKE